MLDDCLPNKLRIVFDFKYEPDRILRRIDKLQKELDELKSMPVKKLAENNILNHYSTPKAIGGFGPFNHKPRKENELLLTQLKKWKPNSKAGKTLRKNLIAHMNTLFNNNISSPFDIPELLSVTREMTYILNRKIELTNTIKDLKKKYPLSLAYQAKRKELEADLMKDLDSF
jgi:hypothetical protein